MNDQLSFDDNDDQQGGLEAGRAGRDEGTSRVWENEDAEWKEGAWEVMAMLAKTPRPFNAEDLRQIAGSPNRPRAMGALFLAAARSGMIVSVGYATANRAERHAGVLQQWLGAEHLTSDKEGAA